MQKALEQARQNGKIGKSLEATVYIHSEEEFVITKEEMEFFLVVSQVEYSKPSEESISSIKSENYSIEIILPKESECPRCWKHTRDKRENGLCNRCDEAIK